MKTAQNASAQLTPLDNKACIEAYVTPFPLTKGNLLLITESNNTVTALYGNNSLLGTYLGDPSLDPSNLFPPMSYKWLCSKNEFELFADRVPSCSDLINKPESLSLNASMLLVNGTRPGEWTSLTFPIEGCISQQLEPKCTVEASLLLTGIVIVFVTCKIACMIWMVWQLAEEPLAVLGDAVASFISCPDSRTTEACLASNQKAFRKKARYWSPKPARWGQAASMGQWLTCCILYASSSYFFPIKNANKRCT